MMLNKQQIENIKKIFNSENYINGEFFRLLYNSHMDLYQLEMESSGILLDHLRVVCMKQKIRFCNASRKSFYYTIDWTLRDELLFRKIDETTMTYIFMMLETTKFPDNEK